MKWNSWIGLFDWIAPRKKHYLQLSDKLLINLNHDNNRSINNIIVVITHAQKIKLIAIFLLLNAFG